MRSFRNECRKNLAQLRRGKKAHYPFSGKKLIKRGRRTLSRKRPAKR
jgi:hypothetical protein